MNASVVDVLDLFHYENFLTEYETTVRIMNEPEKK
jgi:hypothetical protein